MPADVMPSFAVTNRRRWAMVALLFSASLINYFDRATISFALPLISKEMQRKHSLGIAHSISA